MCIATIGAVATAASAVYGGVTAAENAHYQAQVARNNAKTAGENAVYSAQAASANTESAGLKAAQKLSAVTAGQAANNIDVNTGSAADVSTSQRELGQIDVDNEATRGALQTYGYESQQQNYIAQARADQAQVVPDIFGGFLKAGGSVASNASQLGIGGGGSGGSDIPGGGSLMSSAPDIPDGYSWMNDGSYSYGASDDWDR